MGIQEAELVPDDDWSALGMERLELEWNNERDAVYDDWRRLYGVPQT